MIPDSLFSPPQSPFFFLLRVPFSSSSKSLFLPSPSPVPPLRVPLPTLQFIFLPLKVLSHPPRFPFQSSPSPLPSSSSSLLLFLASKNSGTTRSRPAVLGWCVPKWNMILLFYFAFLMVNVSSVASSSSHFTSGNISSSNIIK